MSPTPASSPPSALLPQLNHIALNAHISGPTLIFLHGGGSSHKEWLLTASHLPTYHILLPDLTAHGVSTSSLTSPFTLPTTTTLLAALIAEHAHHGRAHVIGLSLGGFSALHLAATHPDRVASLFVTGCARRIEWPDWTIWLLSVFAGTVNWLMCILLPKRWVLYLAGVSADQVPHGMYEDCVGAMGFWDAYWMLRAVKRDAGPRVWKAVRCRTCIVAGEKSRDGREDTRAVGRVLREGNEESLAVVARGMGHAWSLQDGALFARAVEAWVERERLPDEFEVLELDGDGEGKKIV